MTVIVIVEIHRVAVKVTNADLMNDIFSKNDMPCFMFGIL